MSVCGCRLSCSFCEAKASTGCPQEYLWQHARLIKEFLGVNDETHIFFYGLAIGYRDEAGAVNNFERSRVPLGEQIRFLGF